MPRSCCVPGCKSNYNSTLNAGGTLVSSFGFPRDESRKAKWLNAIPRTDWTPSKHSVVCYLHFSEHDIIRHEMYRLPDGNLQKIWTKSRLKPDTVPSIFPDMDSYSLNQACLKPMNISRTSKKSVRKKNKKKDHTKERDPIDVFVRTKKKRKYAHLEKLTRKKSNSAQEDVTTRALSLKKIPVKRPILVFQDLEPFLIYNGYLYCQIKSDAKWLCTNGRTKGCTSELRFKKDRVLSASKHTCVTNINDGDSLLLLQSREYGKNYAIYGGYVYKRTLAFYRDRNIFKWNCLRMDLDSLKMCQGILTTKDDQVIAASIHTCKHDGDDGVEETQGDVEMNSCSNKLYDSNEVEVKPSSLDIINWLNPLEKKHGNALISNTTATTQMTNNFRFNTASQAADNLMATNGKNDRKINNVEEVKHGNNPNLAVPCKNGLKNEYSIPEEEVQVKEEFNLDLYGFIEDKYDISLGNGISDAPGLIEETFNDSFSFGSISDNLNMDNNVKIKQEKFTDA